MTIEKLSSEFLNSIQPIVLVGGKSRRFGRDKLLEPWGNNGHVLVQSPIQVLRSVFGNRVKLVGECAQEVLALADGSIRDLYPGLGPIGGIVSALSHWHGGIFVLAGDMPHFNSADVLRILSTATTHPNAMAVLAATNQLHPCAGFYSNNALPLLVTNIAAGRFQLSTALEASVTIAMPVEVHSTTNINFQTDVQKF